MIKGSWWSIHRYYHPALTAGMVASHAAFIRGARSHECGIAGKYHHDQQPGGNVLSLSGTPPGSVGKCEGRNCKTWIQTIKVGLTYI